MERSEREISDFNEKNLEEVNPDADLYESNQLRLMTSADIFMASMNKLVDNTVSKNKNESISKLETLRPPCLKFDGSLISPRRMNDEMKKRASFLRDDRDFLEKVEITCQSRLDVKNDDEVLLMNSRRNLSLPIKNLVNQTDQDNLHRLKQRLGLQQNSSATNMPICRTPKIKLDYSREQAQIKIPAKSPPKSPSKSPYRIRIIPEIIGGKGISPSSKYLISDESKENCGFKLEKLEESPGKRCECEQTENLVDKELLKHINAWDSFTDKTSFFIKFSNEKLVDLLESSQKERNCLKNMMDRLSLFYKDLKKNYKDFQKNFVADEPNEYNKNDMSPKKIAEEMIQEKKQQQSKIDNNSNMNELERSPTEPHVISPTKLPGIKKQQQPNLVKKVSIKGTADIIHYLKDTNESEDCGTHHSKTTNTLKKHLHYYVNYFYW